QLIALSYYGLAQVKFQQHPNNHAEIKHYFWQAVHANAKHALTHYQLARIYRLEHRYKEAIDQFQAAIESNPTFEPAYTAWKDLVAHWQDLPDKKKTDKPFCRTLASKYESWGENF